MNVGSITHIHMLALTIDDVDNIERTNQFQKKILITVFINGNNLVLLDIKPQNVKIFFCLKLLWIHYRQFTFQWIYLLDSFDGTSLIQYILFSLLIKV